MKSVRESVDQNTHLGRTYHVGASESAPSLAESPGSGPVGHAHYSALPGLHQARAPPLWYTTEHLSNTELSQNDSTYYQFLLSIWLRNYWDM